MERINLQLVWKYLPKINSYQGVFRVDSDLEGFKGHFMYRWESYNKMKEHLAQSEGGLLQFSKGYENFGFSRRGQCVIFREWAPSAAALALIGDFNNWQGTWGERDKFGVWTVKIPDNVDGTPGIEHGSRVKVRLRHHDGWVRDLLPAWVRWAVQDPDTYSYNGVFWDPPTSEQHRWQNPQPVQPKTLRIYEAHVGMSSEEPEVASYSYFKDNVLPRIKALGYNTVQLMAVQEHAYYGSFGYHVTSPFAVSSRCGTPEELKALVDEAHRLGLLVLLDVVHSHASKDPDGLAGFDLGQEDGMNYFLTGPDGYHSLWDSRLFNYRNWETLRYLLSNLRWWQQEYRFDGFRFDGVTSMLYHHHGIHMSFSGDYNEYFGLSCNTDAVVYLMLANDLVHTLNPQAVTVAEDVSGMPALCRPVHEGGCGFDARLGMGIPDLWIDLLKNRPDENWGMHELVANLCNRRSCEVTVAYAESHDQSIVGDKTLAMWLLNEQIYTGMSTLGKTNPVVQRGVALHKMIRLLTLSLGGNAWLNFMGNEFGHPEWIDFPREGNGWSHQYCRRQWNLVDDGLLRYAQINDWDKGMMTLDQNFSLMASPHLIVSEHDDERKLIVLERGPLVFVFNFHTTEDYKGLKVGVGLPGKYRVMLDSDAFCYGGQGRVGHDVDHFTSPEGIPGQPETNFNNRPHSMMVLSPSRTVVVYGPVGDDPPQQQPPASGRARRARA